MEILHGKKKKKDPCWVNFMLLCSVPTAPRGQSLQASPVLTGVSEPKPGTEGAWFPSPLRPAPFPFLFNIPATCSLSVPAPRTGRLIACQALLSPRDLCPQEARSPAAEGNRQTTGCSASKQSWVSAPWAGWWGRLSRRPWFLNQCEALWAWLDVSPSASWGLQPHQMGGGCKQAGKMGRPLH